MTDSSKSDLIDDWSHLGLPFMGNQVDQLILGCILDATEHVTQVFVGVDVVYLAELLQEYPVILIEKLSHF